MTRIASALRFSLLNVLFTVFSSFTNRFVVCRLKINVYRYTVILIFLSNHI